MLTHPVAAAELRDVQSAAARLGVQLVVPHANSDNDFEAAPAHAISLSPWRHAIISLPPSSCPEFAKAGGLLAYGNSLADIYRQLGASMPVAFSKAPSPPICPWFGRASSSWCLISKTARTLGINISDNLLLLADETIE